MQVAVSISEGSVEWTLLDPDGTNQWTDEESGFSDVQSSRQFEAAPGVWRLRVVASGMQGGYHVTWTTIP